MIEVTEEHVNNLPFKCLAHFAYVIIYMVQNNYRDEEIVAAAKKFGTRIPELIEDFPELESFKIWRKA